MEEKSTMQKLTLKDFEGIELDPNGFQIDYLAAIAKRAMDIFDRESHMKKKDKGKQKLSDSDHLDEQHKKKNKLEEINKETLDPTRFSEEVCIKGMAISREHKRMCMKEPSKTVIKRSDQRKRSEDSLQSRHEVLRREKLLKRPMVMDKTAGDHESHELKKSKKSKNAKKLDMGHTLDPPPNLPREFMETLQRFAEGKSIEEPKLVIQKNLFATDISRCHNRLSMPIRHLLNKFLTQDEMAELELRNGKNVKTIEVDIIEPSLQKGKVSLRRWEMEKKSGNSSISYVFSRTWNSLVSRNSLCAKQVVQVWSTRIDGKLWFLLVRVPKRGEKNPVLTTSVSQLPRNENQTAGPSSSSSLEPNPSNEPGPSSSSLESAPSNEPGPSSSSWEPDRDHPGQDI